MTEVFTTVAASLPCNWNVDTSCCDTWDGYSTQLQTAAAEYGAMVLWAATGRRFGLCERTIRPCGMTSGNNVIGYYWSDGTWFPYIFNGVWRNCSGCAGSSFGCCTCEPTCQVWLPAPVNSIPATGVSVDGAIVNVDSWRVDNGMWLVRTDGECWPTCNDYDVDSGVGVFQVTYLQGLAVPSVLLRAAGEIACEYAKSCTGAACRLPQRVQSLTRQGVSISMVDVDDLLKAGFTGIQTVDQVIAAFNPYGLKSPPRVYSPDAPVTRMVTYP